MHSFYDGNWRTPKMLFANDNEIDETKPYWQDKQNWNEPFLC